jgi:hypothetical protein
VSWRRRERASVSQPGAACFMAPAGGARSGTSGDAHIQPLVARTRTCCYGWHITTVIVMRVLAVVRRMPRTRLQPGAS